MAPDSEHANYIAPFSSLSSIVVRVRESDGELEQSHPTWELDADTLKSTYNHDAMRQWAQNQIADLEESIMQIKASELPASICSICLW